MTKLLQLLTTINIDELRQALLVQIQQQVKPVPRGEETYARDGDEALVLLVRATVRSAHLSGFSPETQPAEEAAP